MPAKQLVPLIALFLLFLLLTIVFGGQVMLATTFAGFSVITAVLLAIGLARSRPPTDPYDLRLLKQIHEEAELEGVEEAEVQEDAGIVCPHCGTVYAAWIPVCPNCKRSSNARTC